jgi:guanine deaminase
MTGPAPAPKRAAALRGRAASLTGNPFLAEGCLQHVEDALILIEDGRIAAFGPYAATAARIPDGVPVTDYANALILPGLIDTHVHYPQLQMIASYGEQLLAWL